MSPESWAELRRAIDSFAETEADSPEGTTALDAIVSQLYDAGLIVPFDWPTWAAEHPSLRDVAVADPVEAVKYLTAVVRADRFSDGTLAAAVESGGMLRALLVVRAAAPAV